MIRLLLLIAAVALFAVLPFPGTNGAQPTGSGADDAGVILRVGSKKFTESVILGEIAAQLLRSEGAGEEHLAELGGSRFLFNGLLSGDLDVYPEYTGTLRREILGGGTDPIETDDQLSIVLKAQGVETTEPLGFNNTYAIAVLRNTAEQYDLATISDLARHPELTLSFSNEFMDRGDGWPGLRARYGLTHGRVSGVDHDIAYRQLRNGTVDVIDAYATDAKLREADVVLLEDDRQFFPRYDAVLLYSEAAVRKFNELPSLLNQLAGTLSDERMAQLNHAAEGAGQWESTVAASFLKEEFDIEPTADEITFGQRLWRHTVEHLELVRRSLLPAILTAIPLGVLAAKKPRLGAVVLGVTGVIQTIPALALLVMLMPLVALLNLPSLGSGSATAIAALFLYSLLPIVRNTCTGLQAIPADLRESALALGLSWPFRLLHVELPLAAPHILAGIKTAAVLNIGFATLGALIGAGGYGQPILTGIRRADNQLIMLGALPAAAMAIAAQMLFRAIELWMAPRGLGSREQA